MAKPVGVPSGSPADAMPLPLGMDPGALLAAKDEEDSDVDVNGMLAPAFFNNLW